ncbi:MAG: DNA-directed RNA polymerase [Candidatus Nanoarchaeia archaeon]|nr:DNA-directed RNA polymerase [Candidatus Nanoarchaeia archaeon]MDD5239474.1 DNA-directed RNA polymerase [Candidatus Nanoarchaeia archaeon]
MYEVVELKSNIRVPPQFLGKGLKDAVAAAINKEFVGYTGKEGLFIALTKVRGIGEGTMIPGDGAVYYETTFEMLLYKPMLQEVVNGIVSEITEFGTFIRIGPIDGLVHVSQVMDDYVSYSDAGVLAGKDSKRTLKTKDSVLARVIAISLKSIKGAKLGLTMRQPGLGKLEWIDAEKKKVVDAAAEAEEAKAGKVKKTGKESKADKKKK